MNSILKWALQILQQPEEKSISAPVSKVLKLIGSWFEILTTVRTHYRSTFKVRERTMKREKNKKKGQWKKVIK